MENCGWNVASSFHMGYDGWKRQAVGVDKIQSGMQCMIKWRGRVGKWGP
jgi:hypothetical protein